MRGNKVFGFIDIIIFIGIILFSFGIYIDYGLGDMLIWLGAIMTIGGLFIATGLTKLGGTKP